MDFSETNKDTVKSDINMLIEKAELEPEVIDKLLLIVKKKHAKNESILIRENLDWNALSFFYTIASEIRGLVIKKTLSRFYPYPEIFSHIIGYTGSPSQPDVENSENLALLLPTAKIGKTCIEKMYDEKLFGTAGLKQVEVNSRREQIKLLNNIDDVDGQDIYLTINKKLQERIYKILSEQKSAVCIVMNVHNGEILACVSYPGYDTNIFSFKTGQKTLQDLYSDPYKSMTNKAISGLYSPGSVFKMIAGLGALSSGKISKYTRFSCSGCCELGKYKFHCWSWKFGGHGSVNLVQAIERSCDVFFYNVAKLVSPDIIAKVANDFGLGLLTGIDLPNEKSGLIPTKKWKRTHKKQSWTNGDSFNMAIGQGFVLVTPIQLVKMVAIMANGLRPVTPHLVKKHHAKSEPLNFEEAHISLIQDGMFDVVNGERGTARRLSTNDDSFQIAGKTGSSQVCRITEAQRLTKKTSFDDYWKKEHAVFVGYAPADEPVYAICTLVEHGGGGAAVAAPIAKDILFATREIIEGIMPTTNNEEDVD
jgi:penicillin-binding protein 2